MKTVKCNCTAILYLLSLALALRLFVPLLALAVGADPQTREPDSVGYIESATELAKSGRFVRQNQPELVRTPGYPLFLLPGVLVGQVDPVTIGLQALTGCLTAWLVYSISRLIFSNERTAFFAAVLYACEPLSVLYASKLLTESLFTCLVTLFLYCVVNYWRQARARHLLTAAIAVAGAAYVRPIAYYLPAYAGAILLLTALIKSDSRGKRIGHALGFVALSMALILPWQIRNYVQAGYAKFSAISDVNLYFYQAAAVLATRQGTTLSNVQAELGYSSDDIYLKQHPEQRDWPMSRRFAYQGSEGSRILRDDPWVYVPIHLAGIRSTIFDVGTSAYAGFFGLEKADDASDKAAPVGRWERLVTAIQTRPLIVVMHLFLRATLLGYYVLAIFGLVSRKTWKNSGVLVMLAIAAYFVLLSGGPVGYHRFRLPLVPIIAVLAGQGITVLKDRWTLRDGSRTTTPPKAG